MTFELLSIDLALVRVGLPDVAHDTAAIARAVNAQREDRQRLDRSCPPRGATPAGFGERHHQATSSNPRSAERILAARRATQRATSRSAPSTRLARTPAGRRLEDAASRVAHDRHALDHRQADVGVVRSRPATRTDPPSTPRSTIRSAGPPASAPGALQAQHRCRARGHRDNNCPRDSCRVRWAARSSSSRSPSPLRRESVPSATAAAGETPHVGGLPKRKSLDDGHHTSDAARGEHAVGARALKRDAVNQHGIRAKATERAQRLDLPAPPRRRRPRPRGPSTASSRESAGTTAATPPHRSEGND